MLIKAGVDISRLRPEIRKKLPIIEKIVYIIEGEELIISSTYEGDHGAGSLHYADLAVDIRSGKKRSEVKTKIKQDLGPDYDVIVYETFIHIEYDPK